jgi:hypothetical protein
VGRGAGQPPGGQCHDRQDHQPYAYYVFTLPLGRKSPGL